MWFSPDFSVALLGLQACAIVGLSYSLTLLWRKREHLIVRLVSVAVLIDLACAASTLLGELDELRALYASVSNNASNLTVDTCRNNHGTRLILRMASMAYTGALAAYSQRYATQATSARPMLSGRGALLSSLWVAGCVASTGFLWMTRDWWQTLVLDSQGRAVACRPEPSAERPIHAVIGALSMTAWLVVTIPALRNFTTIYSNASTITAVKANDSVLKRFKLRLSVFSLVYAAVVGWYASHNITVALFGTDDASNMLSFSAHITSQAGPFFFAIYYLWLLRWLPSSCDLFTIRETATVQMSSENQCRSTTEISQEMTAKSAAGLAIQSDGTLATLHESDELLASKDINVYETEQSLRNRHRPGHRGLTEFDIATALRNVAETRRSGAVTPSESFSDIASTPQVRECVDGLLTAFSQWEASQPARFRRTLSAQSDDGYVRRSSAVPTKSHTTYDSDFSWLDLNCAAQEQLYAPVVSTDVIAYPLSTDSDDDKKSGFFSRLWGSSSKSKKSKKGSTEIEAKPAPASAASSSSKRMSVLPQQPPSQPEAALSLCHRSHRLVKKKRRQ
ncbi:hypothetical protein BDF19DRAFT_416908 [Syncephalis fuscata]|nr:hypothetical protein BDF19DRAFT_416908 [Syncephalis fuscata]